MLHNWEREHPNTGFAFEAQSSPRRHALFTLFLTASETLWAFTALACIHTPLSKAACHLNDRSCSRGALSCSPSTSINVRVSVSSTDSARRGAMLHHEVYITEPRPSGTLQRLGGTVSHSGPGRCAVVPMTRPPARSGLITTPPWLGPWSLCALGCYRRQRMLKRGPAARGGEVREARDEVRGTLRPSFDLRSTPVQKTRQTTDKLLFASPYHQCEQETGSRIRYKYAWTQLLLPASCICH
ncbi:hypothetical protein BC628DRAFT_837551 [Trametes gibbosa]|nr:hypothetical protein BC628DRAFT_837551 [Trametes gibbosa]